MIVRECEHYDLFAYENDGIKPTSEVWSGAPGYYRGIEAVFDYDYSKLELLDIHNPKYKYVLPIENTDEDFTFILLAVWTYETYTKQIWDAIKHYSDLLNGNNSIASDFNSNTI